MKHYLTFGEPLPLGTASSLLGSLPPNAKLINGYGPAECTLCSTLHTVTENDIRSGKIPIGQPDPSHRCLVCDEQLVPVADGEIGELFVGGPAIFGAYLNRPDLTASALITIPKYGKEKFYRTGDLVRMDARLNLLYFVGRKDFQIKLRGQRIESGEIEQVLVSCLLKKPITHAVVLKKEYLGLEHLVAYVESDEDKIHQKLRAHCELSLPQYMVPSLFISLNHFPLNANGKINRKALPEPDFSKLILEHQELENFEVPRTTTEHAVVRIWQDLLGIDGERISTKTNFFSISGNSLLLMRLVRLYETVLCEKRSFRSMIQFFPEATVQKHAYLIDEHLRIIHGKESNEWISSNTTEGPASQSQISMFADSNVRFSTITDTALNNVLFIYKLKGTLCVDRLRLALNHVIFKQTALRTSLCFNEETGELRQKIMDFNDGDCYDFAETSVNTKEELGALFANEKKNKNLLDQSAGRVFRCFIIHYDNNDTFVCFNFHYVSADGESHIIFAKELQKAYARPFEDLDPLNISYLDYAWHQWRASHEGNETLIKHKAIDYWKTMFDKTTSVAFLEGLPYDRVSSQARSGCGCTCSVAIPVSLAEQIHGMARCHHVTVADVTLAAFYVLLFRLTHENDMHVGVPYADRNEHSSLYDIIGSFVNVLPIRCQIEPNESFISLIARFRALVVSCVTNARPYMHILRQTNCAPLRILCQIEWTPWHERSIALDETSTLVPFQESSDALFDMLCCFDIGKGDSDIRIKLNASTDVFDKQTICDIQQRLVILLAQLVSSPHKPLLSFSIILPHEIGLVESLLGIESAGELMPANRSIMSETSKIENTALLIHDHFAFIAHGQPQKMAVLFDEQCISFAEILYASQEMAELLIENGYVKNVGDIICQCVEKSIEMIIGMMAILMAGAVYCPLSPEEPRGRLERLLKECKPTCVLVHSQTKDHFSSNTIIVNTPSIIQDTFIQKTFNTFGFRSLSIPIANSLAFVIFTSGSTGQPKGVCLTHRNFTAYIKHELAEGIMIKGDVVLQRTPVTFSMHLQETIGALWIGSSIVLIRQSAQRDLTSILNAINQDQISYILLTPVLLAALFKDTIDFSILASIRVVQTAGEPLKSTIAAKALACLPISAKLVNAYGQTEAPLDIWHHEVSVADLSYDNVSLGRKPFSNYSTMILDQYCQPVIPGVAGELCISGDGIFLGYLNRPELTSDTIIKISYNEKERFFYRTGDLVRMCPISSFIYFIGRKDFQIKLRGSRIECGEIEYVLSICPNFSVNRAVVVKHEHIGIDYLVAYLELEKTCSPAFNEIDTDSEDIQHKLRGHCQDNLPEYMVPTLFVILHHFPLNANGKLDRKALPIPNFSKELVATRQLSANELPQTDMEQNVHNLWQELLNITNGQISMTSNLFNVGGNSLLLMHLVRLYETRLSSKCVGLRMADFFQMPTIREHAKLLSTCLILAQ
ncbi:unnamed protein product [Rotaria magnacalcarata]|uniref:Carrier domain-containing protein n=1 Tax=Rotaria magnacalcarata TaxID=392030 RepID=A0A8S2KLX6_9BILA|nr:unnamed protein product [Rotaria magnacalcarata]CAF3873241.1 unnamed protein product [Rotaria magnacalcarata]